MKLFLDRRYTMEKIPCDDNVVDILVLNVRSCIRHGVFDEDMQRIETYHFGVNYWDRKWDCSPITRWFKFNWKLLIAWEERWNLFYDHDKIGDMDHEQRVFEWTWEEFIDEFLKKWYQLKNM